jgi:mono/diheme cytochrome c family protein
MAFMVATSQTSADAADRVRFNEQVRPLLSDRCFACHGPDAKRREADLRLDLREHAIGDGDGPAGISPGNPEASPIWERITSSDSDQQMPPPSAKKPKFTEAERELIRRWIEEGAEYEGHWAFLPLRTATPPREPSSTHPIDAFIRTRLSAAGITPSPPADRATLLRRVTLDLTGVLPCPEDVAAFENDSREDAYVRVIDRLLASPQYGERWGRHWLDQARYADSNGYAIDAPRDMWPYRDWVIDAFNRDMPFDQFTVEQLAGDLLPNPTKSQLIATGFHRNTLINQEGGTDREQFRVEAAMDRVATTGAVWLGLTVGCAQCHTHKFDPITQREYYQFFAFFNSAQDANDRGPTVEVRQGEVYGNPVHIPATPKPPTKEELAKLRTDWEQSTLARLAASPEGLTADERSLLIILQKKADERSKTEAGELQSQFVKAVPRAVPIKKEPKSSLVQLMVMRDLPQPRETFLFTRGDFTRPDKDAGTLSPGVISAVAPALSETDAPRTRLDLARWLIHPDNPLTSRVTVNRVWMRYFGRGLVETEEDFGTQGTPPVHPELLDWLSREFQRQTWSLKSLHRLIVTSETYRQTSNERPEAAERDPRNLLLARQQRLRLEAEVVRDAALSASGLLNITLGGPSVFPPQPDGVYAFTQVNKSWPTETGPQRFRRTLYTFFYRSAPYPLFATFDAPDFQAVCTRRLRSNTPLQALTLANDVVFLELAQGLAARLANECPGPFAEQLDARIARGVRLCFGRQPTITEAHVLRDYVTAQATDLESDSTSADRLTTSSLRQSLKAHEAAGLVLLARTLLNADNFITRE